MRINIHCSCSTKPFQKAVLKNHAKFTQKHFFICYLGGPLAVMGHFSFYLGFFHKHSQFTELQGKGEGICLTPLYHFRLIHRHLDISQQLLQGAYLCTQSAARLEPETFGIRLQISNH